MFASNIGAPMFIGISGTAAASGIAVTTFEWHVRDLIHSTEIIKCCYYNINVIVHRFNA